MRTKDRDQFNVYLKPTTIAFLKEESTRRGITRGDLIEAMADVYNLKQLRPMLQHFADQFNREDPTTDQEVYLRRLRDWINRLLSPAPKG